MGRKALDKDRKNSSSKKEKWALALFDYFQIEGLKKVSMDDIALEIKRSKSTLYEYFESKDEIISLMVQLKLQDLNRFAEIISNKELDFFKRYELSMAQISNQLSSVSNLFLSDLKELYPEMWEAVQFFIRQSTFLLKEYYEEGIKTGAFREINIDVLTLTDTMFFNALTNPETLKSLNISLKEALVAFLDIKMNGVRKI
jgi:AcrR family transcriptional regulator